MTSQSVQASQLVYRAWEGGVCHFFTHRTLPFLHEMNNLTSHECCDTIIMDILSSDPKHVMLTDGMSFLSRYCLDIAKVDWPFDAYKASLVLSAKFKRTMQSLTGDRI